MCVCDSTPGAFLRGEENTPDASLQEATRAGSEVIQANGFNAFRERSRWPYRATFVFSRFRPGPISWGRNRIAA